MWFEFVRCGVVCVSVSVHFNERTYGLAEARAIGLAAALDGGGRVLAQRRCDEYLRGIVHN